MGSYNHTLVIIPFFENSQSHIIICTCCGEMWEKCRWLILERGLQSDTVDSECHSGIYCSEQCFEIDRKMASINYIWKEKLGREIFGNLRETFLDTEWVELRSSASSVSAAAVSTSWMESLSTWRKLPTLKSFVLILSCSLWIASSVTSAVSSL